MQPHVWGRAQRARRTSSAAWPRRSATTARARRASQATTHVTSTSSVAARRAIKIPARVSDGGREEDDQHVERNHHSVGHRHCGARADHGYGVFVARRFVSGGR